MLCLFSTFTLGSVLVFSPHRHGSPEEGGLLDDVAHWLLLLLDHAFVDKTLQPRLGLGGGHVQRVQSRSGATPAQVLGYRSCHGSPSFLSGER